MGHRLRDNVSWLTLTAVAISRNLGPIFMTVLVQALVKQIVQPKGAQVYLATDVEKLSAKYGDGAYEIWRDFFPRNDEAFEFQKADDLKEKFLFVQDSTLADPEPDFKHAITGEIGLTCLD